MKGVRFTPLNLISASLIIAIAYLFAFADDTGWRKLGSISLTLLLLISAITDLLFRLKFKSLKRIWIVESIFLIFVLLLLVLIRGI